MVIFYDIKITPRCYDICHLMTNEVLMNRHVVRITIERFFLSDEAAQMSFELGT